MNIEEGEALNHLMHMEEWIIRLLKGLKDLKKERNALYPSVFKQGVLYGLA